MSDDEMMTLQRQNASLERILKGLQIDDASHRKDARRDIELEQVIADIKLKNRQTTTEFWKVGIAAVVGGAVIGGLVVQIINVTGG